MKLLSLVVAFAAVCGATAKKDFTDQLREVVKVDASKWDDLSEAKVAFALAFSKGGAPESAAGLAEKIEGFGRVGWVDVEKETELLKVLGLTAETVPAWRTKAIGAETWVDQEDADKAAEAVLGTIPDDLCPMLSFEGVQAYVQQSVMEKKIPAIIFTEKSEVPKLWTKMALWMGEQANYAVVPNPPEEVMKGFQMKKLPAIYVYVPQPAKEGEDVPEGATNLMPIKYNRKMFGGLKFKNVIRFMAQVTQEMMQMGFLAKPESQGSSKSSAGRSKSAKMEPLFQVTAETPEACVDSKLGMCVVGLFDGSPLNEEALKQQLEVLTEVQKLPSNKGRPLHFMWVDLTCHPSYGSHFGLSLENAPTVLVISPKKALWAQYFGGFETKKIGSFISGVLGGKNRIAPLPGDKKVPVVSADEDCSAIHAAMTAPIEEDELDMDDIMAEMRADAEEKAEQDAADLAKAKENEVDSELEEKKKRAQAEMDRLNKRDNKGRRKKKKKKNKKKKKKAKTEL